MRARSRNGDLIVHAISGNHVVMLTFDTTLQTAQDSSHGQLLGYAIQRIDHTEDEKYWLKAMKTFEAVEPHPAEGLEFSTFDHPIQSFNWADYSAKPDHEYTYRVVARRGLVTAPDSVEEASVTIKTEPLYGPRHCVFFNRGAASSQEYARRFLNKDPDDVGPAAFEWLSRGLHEAILEHVALAQGPNDALFGALYEFHLPSVLNAFKAASDRGAHVQVVYDDVGMGETNDTVIDQCQVRNLCKPRKNEVTIAHNKFIVYATKDGNDWKPRKVWTGSTNISMNGVFGHSNVGHLIDDEDMAAKYYEYWKEEFTDPPQDSLKDWTEAHTSAPDHGEPMSCVFSPRHGLKALNWYAEVAASANDGLFMALAFGMHKSFLNVYQKEDQILKMALMDSKGMTAAASAQIDLVRKRRNVIIAVGNTLATNTFDRWLREKNISFHGEHIKIHYVHTKFMLVDPLGEHPTVVTGSANFSEGSTNANDENMVVIRDDDRVADIYLTEFIRLHSHYAFREAVKIAVDNHETWKPNFLIPDDSWVGSYFAAGGARSLRRGYFSKVAREQVNP